MAAYKVPQDVEAEDKLLGPFSFRQFVYLIIAALGILMAWLLSQIFIGLLVIPLPLIGFFLILALPLKKDQPMETYLIAVVRFFLKPRRRLWDPEGNFTMVEITAPKIAEVHLTKDFTGDQASEQLSYLAQVVDTHGWSSRGVTSPNGMSDIVVAEAQEAEDVLDENAGVARNFASMITQSNSTHKQELVQQFQQAVRTPVAPPPQPVKVVSNPPQAASVQPDDTPAATPTFDPYPVMRQHVLDPHAGDDVPVTVTPPAVKPQKTAQQKPQASSSDNAVSPDIIRLANNNDLSISTIAHEAQRLKDRGDEEVVIELH